ncbi:hypothetical protein QSH18_11885 [Xanthomonas sp. NCPPB 2654]|nr:hypothetical protein [Xanthomonas sp. NCPPB 2654]
MAALLQAQWLPVVAIGTIADNFTAGTETCDQGHLRLPFPTPARAAGPALCGSADAGIRLCEGSDVPSPPDPSAAFLAQPAAKAQA